MNATPGSRSNPFASRQVRPGRIAFRSCDDADVSAAVDEWIAIGGERQIIGPHGSGKSTLLLEIAERLRTLGRATILELHDGQRRLHGPQWKWLADEIPQFLLIDGYEQLGRLSRWRIRRYCRRNKTSLLVTTHADTGMATLYSTRVTAQLLTKLVDELLARQEEVSSSDAQVMQRMQAALNVETLQLIFTRHGGNLREVFFDCYDLCEAARRQSANTTPK